MKPLLVVARLFASAYPDAVPLAPDADLTIDLKSEAVKFSAKP